MYSFCGENKGKSYTLCFDGLSDFDDDKESKSDRLTGLIQEDLETQSYVNMFDRPLNVFKTNNAELSENLIRPMYIIKSKLQLGHTEVFP